MKYQMETLEGLFQYSTSPIMAKERIQQQILQANNMANEMDMPSNIENIAAATDCAGENIGKTIGSKVLD